MNTSSKKTTSIEVIVTYRHTKVTYTFDTTNHREKGQLKNFDTVLKILSDNRENMGSKEEQFEDSERVRNIHKITTTPFSDSSKVNDDLIDRREQ